MQDFIYCNKTKMIFGRQALLQLGEETAKLGKKALVVYGGNSCKRSGLLQRALEELEKNGVTYWQLGGVKPNPRMGLAYEGIRICREQGIEVLIGIGGGSVIDTCKTIGLGAKYDGDVWDFFSGKMATASLPLGVVLTIPAAGSESSRDAVMTLEDQMLKRASCGADFIRPFFSIMDPQLTFTLPAWQTACGACDIIAHVLERYFTNTTAVDVTDRLCESLIRSVMCAASIAVKKPDDYDARAEIMLAGSLAHNGMMGLGRAEDWASHGLGHEISALTDAAHGATLAVMMPAWMRYVYKHDIQRFAQFANRVMDVPYMPNREEKMAIEGINRFSCFLRSIGLPYKLEQLSVTCEDIPVMARKCHRAGNFVSLDETDIARIYRMAMEEWPEKEI